ncbi:hypothetical protein [Evansella clarkii]|uniref:hypothetical protein n=1 Tax=Evansella clarkii TaxID=79879 RepID=UPI0009960529|nr:hypothetical protein [Evansella clarkii]
MGYSICIPFENEEEKARMQQFLKQHYRPLKDLIPDVPDGYMNNEPPSDDLSYAGNITEPVLGFDYGSGELDVQRDYYYEICYWMAVHGGKRENNRPVFIYDGFDRWTVYIDEPASDTSAGYVEVNTFGYRRISSLRLMERNKMVAHSVFNQTMKDLELADRVIRDELERLSGLWLSQKNQLSRTNHKIEKSKRKR